MESIQTTLNTTHTCLRGLSDKTDKINKTELISRMTYK